MFFGSIKEINRLLSKEMLNIYIKVTELTFLKLQFFNFKNFSSRSGFSKAPIHTNIVEFWNFLSQL